MQAVRNRKKQVQLKDKTKNQVNVIYPRRTKYGVWVFDDPEVDLQAEPFVGDINKMIDMYANGKKKVIAYISREEIAGETLVLDRVKVKTVVKPKDVEIEKGDEHILEDGWYQLRGTEEVGWLCPATLKYFDKYPKEIHVKIESIK